MGRFIAEVIDMAQVFYGGELKGEGENTNGAIGRRRQAARRRKRCPNPRNFYCMDDIERDVECAHGGGEE